VVDNVSQDDSCRTIKEKFPHVTLIQNKKNYYFAMPTNLGIKKSSGDFLFLLNNDALLEVNTLKILMDKLKDDPKIGAVCPQLLYPNGAIQPSCRRFPTFNNLMAAGLRLDIFFKKNSWKMTDWDHLTPQFVEQPMMSALLIRRSCWQDVGELDERFPLYFNDVDWCYRAALKGWKIYFEPAAKATHFEAWTGKRLGSRQAFFSMQGMYRYFRKHHIRSCFSSKYPLLVGLCGGLLGIWGLKRISEILQKHIFLLRPS